MPRGSRFVSRFRRAFCYLRDGLRCRYCSKPVEPGVTVGDGPFYNRDAATLDHVDPDGDHSVGNLATCCAECNRAKGVDVWEPGPPGQAPSAEQVREFRNQYWKGQV